MDTSILVPAYWPRTSSRGEPDFYVSVEHKQVLLDRDEAFTINRGKALRMRITRIDWPRPLPNVTIRDSSCRMGGGLMMAAAGGSAYAQSLLATELRDGTVIGWIENYRGIPPQVIRSQEP